MLNLEKILKVKQEHEDKWMKYDFVHGVAIGYKRVAGKKTDTIGITVFTTNKRTINEIPEEQRLPESIDGIMVDVVEEEMPNPFNDLKGEDCNMYRPMPGGIQISHLIRKSEKYLEIGIGTLGMFVKCKDDPSNLYILSNWHVLEKMNADIYQPNYTGDNSSKLLVAEVSKGDYYECADAGIAKVNVPSSDVQVNRILEIGTICGIYEGEPELGQLVKKRGRTTQVTHGEIIYIYVTISNGTNRYKNQVIVKSIDSDNRKISKGGDSGSIVLTYDKEVEENNNKVLGLLWGGNEEENIMVYSPIKYVFEELNLEMCK